MNRREKRQRESEKNKQKKVILTKEISAFEEAPIWGKIFFVSFPLLIILGSLYLVFRDNNIYESDLETLHVTLKGNPKYEEHGIRGKRWVVVMDTKEYSKKFIIEQEAYEATNHVVFSSITGNNHIELKVDKDDLESLNDESFFASKYNNVLGVKKDGISFIDLDLVNELKGSDSKWGYATVLFGVVILPYIFQRREPRISIDNAFGILGVIILIVFLIVRYF